MKPIESILKYNMIIFICTNVMVIFLLVPFSTVWSFLNNQVIFIDYRSNDTVSSPCFNDMNDHLIVGQLIR